MGNFFSLIWHNLGFRPWKTSLIFRLILLANITLLTSCDSFYRNPQGNERNEMEVVKEETVSRVIQPPVDLNGPAKIETATFALG
jgi:hypothetical protein